MEKLFWHKILKNNTAILYKKLEKIMLYILSIELALNRRHLISRIEPIEPYFNCFCLITNTNFLNFVKIYFYYFVKKYLLKFNPKKATIFGRKNLFVNAGRCMPRLL